MALSRPVVVQVALALVGLEGSAGLVGVGVDLVRVSPLLPGAMEHPTAFGVLLAVAIGLVEAVWVRWLWREAALARRLG